MTQTQSTKSLPSFSDVSKLQAIRNKTLLQELRAAVTFKDMEITVPSGPTFIKRSVSSNRLGLHPYIERIYWLLTNAKDQFLISLERGKAQWSSSANDVPTDARFCSEIAQRSRWSQLTGLEAFKDEGLRVAPVPFYAHKKSPQIWTAE